MCSKCCNMNKLKLISSLFLSFFFLSCGNSSSSNSTPNIESKNKEKEKLKELNDSLNSMRSELENLKNLISSDSQGDYYYKSLKIGNQTWMVENLNVTTFRNGDPIYEAKSNGEWRDAATSEYAAFCYTPDGILYNWHAVSDFRGLAPEGWHIPKKEEWREIQIFLGGKAFAAKKMKTTNGWRGEGEGEGNGSNESGFSGYPGGGRGDSGEFENKGTYGYWWSASENYYFELFFNHGMKAENISGNGKNGWGFFVRCIKD